jgi:hypothetical protein
MLSTYYNVSITDITGTANAAGFVDHMKVEQYMANNGDVAPTNLEVSTDKVRANIRFKNIVENVQLMGNVYFSNAVATGADVDTPPSVFSFTLECERGDEYMLTPDETANGATLTGANAIARCVERGLIEFRPNYVYPVYDPTQSLPQGPANSSGLANAIARVGSTTITFNVDGLGNSVTAVASHVTVTKII